MAAAPESVVTPPVVLMVKANVPVVPPSAIAPEIVVPPLPDPVKLSVNGLVLPAFETVTTLSKLLELFAQF